MSYYLSIYDNSSQARLEVTCTVVETMIFLFNEEFSHLKTTEHKKVPFMVVYWNIENLGNVVIFSELIQFSSPFGKLKCACIPYCFCCGLALVDASVIFGFNIFPIWRHLADNGCQWS